MGVTMARDTLLSRPMESTKDFKQQMLDLWRSVSMPLDKMKVTSEYGMRFHPIYHRSMAHNGLDFSAPTGTKVYAMLDGEQLKAADLNNLTPLQAFDLLREMKDELGL